MNTNHFNTKVGLTTFFKCFADNFKFILNFSFFFSQNKCKLKLRLENLEDCNLLVKPVSYNENTLRKISMLVLPVVNLPPRMAVEYSRTKQFCGTLKLRNFRQDKSKIIF